MEKFVSCLGLLFLFYHYGTANMEVDFDMHKMMSKIENYTAFCDIIGMPYDECMETVINKEANEGVDENGEKMVVGATTEIAIFDACNPRQKTIALPRHPDPDITIWPTCTRALRCGGCCTSEVFSCEPTGTREKYVKVFDTRLPYAGAHRFRFVGIRAIKIIEHTQCDAQCKTKSHECHKYQTYEARRCRCVCRKERLVLKDTCKKNQIWDDNECDCICPNRNTMKCPEPSYFSTDTCKCTLKTSVTGEIDLDKLFEQLDKGIIGTDIRLENKEDDDLAAETDIDVLGGSEKTTENNDGEAETSTDENGEKTEGGGTDDEAKTVVDETGEAGTEEEKEEKEKSTTTSSTTSTTPSTTSTTSTTTTTTPKPVVTEDPCKGMKCFSTWKPRKLSNGRCQCFPPIRNFN